MIEMRLIRQHLCKCLFLHNNAEEDATASATAAVENILFILAVNEHTHTHTHTWLDDIHPKKLNGCRRR